MASHPTRVARGHALRALAALLLGGAVLAAAAPPAGAGAAAYTRVNLLPPASGGGPGVMEGEIVATPDGAAAVYVEPSGSFFRLVFYRFAPDGSIALSQQIGSGTQTYYEPSLCFDGARYAIAASTITQAEFLVVSPMGATVVAPVALPGIPSGGRTAAFRTRCTPAGYTVFGMVLEPVFPGASTYYTHLYAWRIDPDGTVLGSGDLGILLAPVSYPGFTGAEKEYYDVAFTGSGFLLAYSAECGTPPAFQTCYRVIDLAGNTVRAEAPATIPTSTGPHLATNGRVVGLATLRDNGFPAGNSLYATFFALDGAPLGPSVEYDDPADFPPGVGLGYAPTIAAHGGLFLAAYIYPNPLTLDYTLKLAPFGASGGKLGGPFAVTDPGDLFRSDINLGVELQLAGDGERLFGKGQNSPDFIRIRPITFRIAIDSDGDGVLDDTDVCPVVPDPGQADTGGIGAGSAPDGIGDACQCGDVSGDGRVTLADAVVIQRSLLVPPTAVRTRPDLCDVGGPASPATQDCTLFDAVTIRRALLTPPAAAIGQVCGPATP